MPNNKVMFPVGYITNTRLGGLFDRSKSPFYLYVNDTGTISKWSPRAGSDLGVYTPFMTENKENTVVVYVTSGQNEGLNLSIYDPASKPAYAYWSSQPIAMIAIEDNNDSKNTLRPLRITDHGNSYATDQWLGKDAESQGLWVDDVAERAQVFFAPSWEYPDIRDTDPLRAQLLSKTFNPQDVVDQVISSAKIDENSDFVELGWETSRDKPEFGRAIIPLTVPEDVFDVYFNSPGGIRGQYYMKPAIPDAGEVFERSIISGLIPAINRYFSTNLPNDLKQAMASLYKPSAKTWMDTKYSVPNKGLDEDFSQTRWQSFYNVTENDNIKYYLHLKENRDITIRVGLGGFAPQRTTIVIKGAWINSDEQEWIPYQKERRGIQIAYLGFA